jgi:hypothetical protein
MQHTTYHWRHGLWRSWFSKDFYRDVGTQWHGSGFGYLFFLLFICTLVLSIFINTGLRKGVSELQANYLPQMPAVSFDKGQMTLTSKTTQVIQGPSGHAVIVFDPTNQFSKEHMPKAPILFKPTAVYVMEQAGAITAYKYPQDITVAVDANSAHAFAEHVKRWGIIVLGLGLLLSAYVYRILASLVYSIVGVLIAKGTRSTLHYCGILRIVVMAQTPVIIMSTLGAMFNVYIPHLWIVGVLINLFYITYGIRAASTLPSAAIAVPPEQPAP